jgi:hypothetical protein
MGCTGPPGQLLWHMPCAPRMVGSMSRTWGKQQAIHCVTVQAALSPWVQGLQAAYTAVQQHQTHTPWLLEGLAGCGQPWVAQHVVLQPGSRQAAGRPWAAGRQLLAGTMHAGCATRHFFTYHQPWWPYINAPGSRGRQPMQCLVASVARRRAHVRTRCCCGLCGHLAVQHSSVVQPGWAVCLHC